MHLISIYSVKYLSCICHIPPISKTLQPLLLILAKGIYELCCSYCAASPIRVLMLGRVCVRSCSWEATEAEESWVAWLSEDGDESGQLYSGGARCSIRLDLNIALESRSCLPNPPRLCGTPARSSFLILGSTVQFCSLGWPNNSPVVGARSRSTPAFYLFRVIVN